MAISNAGKNLLKAQIDALNEKLVPLSNELTSVNAEIQNIKNDVDSN